MPAPGSGWCRGGHGHQQFPRLEARGRGLGVPAPCVSCPSGDADRGTGGQDRARRGRCRSKAQTCCEPANLERVLRSSAPLTEGWNKITAARTLGGTRPAAAWPGRGRCPSLSGSPPDTRAAFLHLTAPERVPSSAFSTRGTRFKTRPNESLHKAARGAFRRSGGKRPHLLLGEGSAASRLLGGSPAPRPPTPPAPGSSPAAASCCARPRPGVSPSPGPGAGCGTPT